MKWTYETIKAKALEYKTKKEFREGSKSAYNKASKLGILDDVCSHLEGVVQNWTNEKLAKEALKYKTRNEFKKSNSSAYNFVCKLGILDDVCSHMVNGYQKRTDKELAEEALKYSTRLAFEKGSRAIYQSALYRNILDEICDHMELMFIWTPKLIKEEALKYNHRGEFSEKNRSAYNSALRNGILDEVCGHMGDRLGSCNDALYLWKVKGTNTYKIGITSWRLGDKRINQVANAHSVEAELIALVETDEALNYEKELLTTYTNNNHNMCGDGETEFRILTIKEKNEIEWYMNNLPF